MPICKKCGKSFPNSIIIDGKRHYLNGRSYCLECSPFGKWAEDKYEERICIECGKPFKIYRSIVKNGRNNCCLRECYYKSRNEKLVNSGKRVKSICGICGKEFFRPSYRINSHCKNYCSDECRLKDYNGNKNPNWNGGASFDNYCEKFNGNLRKRVRKFWSDLIGDRCVVCGKSSIEDGNALNVHHVTYDKNICCNGEIPLFVPLCNKHHSKTNYDRDGWEIWFKYYIWGATNGTMKTYYHEDEYQNLYKL